MYRGRLWTMRQYAGYASARETNARFKFLLEQGQTGLSVAFDLPTQIGYDPDDPLSVGEVGRVGVSIPTMEDMELILAPMVEDGKEAIGSMGDDAPPCLSLRTPRRQGHRRMRSPSLLGGEGPLSRSAEGKIRRRLTKIACAQKIREKAGR